MKSLVLTLLVLLAPSPAICQVKADCPWLNVATASGALRSTVSSPMATLSESSATVCNFGYHDESVSRELRITVEQVKDPDQAMTAYKTRCGPSLTPLHAIGNEAVTCAADTKGQSYGDQVIGRVRDQIFTVTLNTNAKTDPFMPRETLEEKAKNVAEQVAGILF